MKNKLVLHTKNCFDSLFLSAGKIEINALAAGTCYVTSSTDGVLHSTIFLTRSRFDGETVAHGKQVTETVSTPTGEIRDREEKLEEKRAKSQAILDEIRENYKARLETAI